MLFSSDVLSVWGAGRQAIDGTYGFEIGDELNNEFSWVTQLGGGLQFTNYASLVAGADAWATIDLSEGSAQIDYDVGWERAFSQNGTTIFLDTSQLVFGSQIATTDAPRLDIDIGTKAHYDVSARSQLEWNYAGLNVDLFSFETSDQGAFNFNLLKAEADLANPEAAYIASDLLDDETGLTGDALDRYLADWSEDNSGHPWYSLDIGLPQLPDGPLDVYGTKGRHLAPKPFFEGRVDIDSIIQTLASSQPKPFDVLEYDINIDLDRDGTVELEGSTLDDFAPASIADLLDKGVKFPLPWWLRQDVDEGEEAEDLLDLAIDLSLMDFELYSDARLFQDIHFIPTGFVVRGEIGGVAVTEIVPLGEVGTFDISTFDGDVSLGVSGQYWAETGIIFDVGIDLELLSLDYDLTLSYGEYSFSAEGGFEAYDQTLISLQSAGYEPALSWTSEASEVTLWTGETFDVEALAQNTGSEALDPVEIVVDDPDNIDFPQVGDPPSDDDTPSPDLGDGLTETGRLSPGDTHDIYDVAILAGTHIDIDLELHFEGSFRDQPSEVRLLLLDADGVVRHNFNAKDIPGGAIAVEHDIENVVLRRTDWGVASDYTLNIRPTTPNVAEPGLPSAAVSRAPNIRQTALVRVSDDAAEDGYGAPVAMASYRNDGRLTGFVIAYEGDDVDNEDVNLLQTAYEADGEAENKGGIRDFDVLDETDDRENDEEQVAVSTNRNAGQLKLTAYAGDDEDRGRGIYVQVSTSTDIEIEIANGAFYDRSIPIYVFDSHGGDHHEFMNTHPVVNRGGAWAYDPDVAMHGDGSFVVAYRAGSEAYLHFFDSDFLPAGGAPARVALGHTLAYSDRKQGFGPAITLTDTGDVIVATVVSGGTRMLSLVTPTGVARSVSLETLSVHDQNDIAVDTLADGRIVVVWDAPTGIRAQIWEADLTSSGEIIQVSSDMKVHANSRRHLDVATTPNGDFVVVYENANDNFPDQDLSDTILARVFRNDGDARSATFIVGGDADSNAFPNVEDLGGTDFVVTYVGDDDHIYMRRFGYDTLPTGSHTLHETIRSDGTAILSETALWRLAEAGDGDVLQLVDAPRFDDTQVSVSKDANGNWVFDPVDNFEGETQITFRIWDGVREAVTGNFDVGTVTIALTVEPVPQLVVPIRPQITWDTTLSEGQTRILTLDDLGFDTGEADTDSVTVSAKLSQHLVFKRTGDGQEVTSFSLAELIAGNIEMSHTGNEGAPALVLQANWTEGGAVVTQSLVAEFDYTEVNDTPSDIILNFDQVLEGPQGRTLGGIEVLDPDDTFHNIAIEAFTGDSAQSDGSPAPLDGRNFIEWDAANNSFVLTSPTYFMGGETLAFDVVATDQSGASFRKQVSLQIHEYRAATREGEIDENGNLTLTQYTDVFELSSEIKEFRALGKFYWGDQVSGRPDLSQSLTLSDADDVIMVRDVSYIDAGGGHNTVLLGDDSADRISEIQSGGSDDTLLGNSQSNIISAGAGTDWIEGAGASDTLSGGLGDDVYVWSRGDGNDEIAEAASGNSDGVDTILFGEDIAEDDVTVAFDGTDALLTIGHETIRIVGQTIATQRIETMRFSNEIEVALPPRDSSMPEVTTTSETLEDGFVRVTTFVGGMRMKQTTTDTENMRAWASFTNEYGGSGERMSRVMTYDDGRVATTQYLDGTRSQMTVEDVNNRYGWETLIRIFDYLGDGADLTKETRFDNGMSSLVTYHKDGSRTVFEQDRPSQDGDDGLRIWTTKSARFSDQGHKETLDFLYDNKDVLQRSYFADGGLKSVFRIDHSNSENWNEIAFNYFASGQMQSRSITYDTGISETRWFNELGDMTTNVKRDPESHWESITTNILTDGSRNVIVLDYEDGASNFGWVKKSSTYAPEGHLVQIVREMDSGTNEHVDFAADGRIVQQTSFDAADTFVWDRKTKILDDAGELEQENVIYDDGRSSVTHYFEGQRTEKLVTDHNDIFDWYIKTFKYGSDGNLTGVSILSNEPFGIG